MNQYIDNLQRPVAAGEDEQAAFIATERAVRETITAELVRNAANCSVVVRAGGNAAGADTRAPEARGGQDGHAGQLHRQDHKNTGAAHPQSGAPSQSR